MKKMTSRDKAFCNSKPLNVRKESAGKKCIDSNGESKKSGIQIFTPGWDFWKIDFKPSPVFDILITVTMIVQAYLYIKYGVILQDPQAEIMLRYNIWNIFFCVAGRFIYDFVRFVFKIQEFDIFNIRYSMKQIKESAEDEFTIADAIIGVALFLLIAATQIFVRPLKLNVSPLDQFLFYVFAAPAEESFFRYFLMGIIIIASVKILEMLLKEKKEISKAQNLIIRIVAAMISGVSFGIAHIQRYSGSDLIAIMINGIEFAIFYAIFKRIDIPLIAHLILNASAGMQVVFGFGL